MFDPQMEIRVKRGATIRGRGTEFPARSPRSSVPPYPSPVLLVPPSLPAIDLQAAEDGGRDDTAEGKPEEQEKQLAHGRSPPFAKSFALIFAATADRLCVPT